jgi:hypothetical protein
LREFIKENNIKNSMDLTGLLMFIQNLEFTTLRMLVYM